MKKKIGLTISVAILIFFITSICFCFPKIENKLNYANSNYQKEEKDETKNMAKSGLRGAKIYFEKIYGAKFEDVKFIRKNQYDIKAYDQETLNNYYFDVRKKEIGGTCEIVACLEMLMYYSSVDSDFCVNDTPEDAFVKIFDACIKDGSTTYKEGTDASCADNCVDITFESYGSDREGNTNWYYLFDNICDSVNSRNPIILDIPGHSTVVFGLETYRVYYSEKVGNKSYTKSKDVEFVSVLTGWKDYALDEKMFSKGMYPVSKITNHYGGYQVVWAEK
ncbi:MAG: hypothetical protein IKR19_01175 [Acholeplasmatales bacterium]|nr:hypothetical protein [Acholeplasmatales bacterium]